MNKKKEIEALKERIDKIAVRLAKLENPTEIKVGDTVVCEYTFLDYHYTGIVVDVGFTRGWWYEILVIGMENNGIKSDGKFVRRVSAGECGIRKITNDEYGET